MDIYIDIGTIIRAKAVRRYKQADVKTMKRNYFMFHTMDPEPAIDDLKEIYEQRKGV